MRYLFRGILIGLLFGVPAGAVGAMTAQRAYSFGLRAGLLTGLGSSVADCIYACIGAFGLSLIGSRMPARSLELQHTIRLIRELDAEIEKIKAAIQDIMDELHSPITTIPGIGYRMGAMILAEVGDFSRFDSPDKLLLIPECPPLPTSPGSLKTAVHTWRSEALDICAAPSTTPPSTSAIVAAYLAKKRAEGKHYNVALSHAAKKLVRLIFALEKSRLPYCPTA